MGRRRGSDFEESDSDDDVARAGPLAFARTATTSTVDFDDDRECRPRLSLGKRVSVILSPRASKRKSFGTLASIRGSRGAAFEGDCRVRRAAAAGCCAAGARRPVRIQRLVVKGVHAFVFDVGPGGDADPAGYCAYAIPLRGVHPVVIRDSAPLIVGLNRGFDVTYVFTFPDVASDMVAYARAVEVTRAFEVAAHDAAEAQTFKSDAANRRTPSVARAVDVGRSFADGQPAA